MVAGSTHKKNDAYTMRLLSEEADNICTKTGSRIQAVSKNILVLNEEIKTNYAGSAETNLSHEAVIPSKANLPCRGGVSCKKHVTFPPEVQERLVEL